MTFLSLTVTEVISSRILTAESYKNFTDGIKVFDFSMILFASHIAVSLANCSVDNVSLIGTLFSLIIKNYAINKKKIMEFVLWISVSWFSKNTKEWNRTECTAIPL